MIKIVLPYLNAENFTEIWAESEASICFDTQHFEAARCTVAFAACEIKTYLNKFLKDEEIEFASEADGSFAIILKLSDDQTSDESYSLIPCDNGIIIEGVGPAGVLYGAYEFLKLQGVRWYAPGENCEVIPSPKYTLKTVTERLLFSPDMNEGRGFDFENRAIESKHIWLWMARNRLDYAVYSHRDHAFQRKLRLHFKAGGHIFEKILDPDRVLESGKTIWEEHRDWYGVPADGRKVTKDNCLSTQFCVSNKGLTDFLASELIQHIKTVWKNEEKLDIWGFDTWGSVCCCEECEKLGNSTDRTLHFMAELRNALNKKGLGNDVRLVSCAYEGTSTIRPPENQLPQCLVDAKDLIVYYPITRCYYHTMDDSSCRVNNSFNEHLKGWTAKEPSMPVVIGEYYNVSKFDDLPILFTEIMKKDLPHYYNIGVRGITYMHFPILNLAMRSLTHMLYAELTWDTNADADKLIDDYFEKFYGEYAEEMKKAYSLLEEAFKYCTQWRAWGAASVLSQLISWNGERPEKPINTDGHFSDHQSIINSGRKSCEMLEKALELFEKAQTDFILNKTLLPKHLSAAVNPLELAKMNRNSQLLYRISADRKFTIYGLDTMRFMTATVELYDALYNGKTDVKPQMDTLTDLYRKLDSYYLPLDNCSLSRNLDCRSGLARTQLGTTVERCMRLYNMGTYDEK